MNRRITAALATALFCAGLGTGYATSQERDTALRGASPASAARALLARAWSEADDGSWERIAVGRVYYLGGDPARGQAIFDAVLAEEHESSDEYRIARVYREAGEWHKARPLFDRYLAENPDDEKALAEIGAYHLLAGDRPAAEDLFERSFASAEEFWATVAIAGAYLGVVPQE